MKVQAVLIFLVIASFCPLLFARLDDDEFREVTRKINKSLKNDPFAAAYGVEKLGEDDSERAAEFVLDLATSTRTHPKVYRQCIKTLESFTSEEAVDFIAGEARRGRASEKIVGAEVLAKLPGENARKALEELAGGRNATVARIAAGSLGERGDPGAADALVELLEKTEEDHGLTWNAALEALRKLAGTGESGPWIASDWRDYWEARKRNEDWKKTNREPEKSGPHTELPEFFGARVISTNVIFVMDLSSSMLQSDPGGQRLERMKQELAKTIQNLDEDSNFNVLGFNSSLFPWKSRLAPANARNKKDAIDFVKKLKAIAYTNTDDALKTALSDRNVDTIILLSDGVPLRKEHNDVMSDAFVQGILDWVNLANRYRRVVIHTFGFDAISKETGGDRCVKFLKDLALDNEGEYHNIR